MQKIHSQTSQPALVKADLVKFETGKRWLIFAALTCGILWFSGNAQQFVQFFNGKPPAENFDFQVYYTAAVVARENGDKRLYSYREIEDPINPEKKIVINPQLDSANPDSTYARTSENTTKVKLQYLYPPFFALLLSPLTHVSYHRAAQLWYILTYIFVSLSIFLTVKIIYKKSLTAVLAAGFIMLLAEATFPMQDLLHAGNVGALILFLYASAIYLQKSNRTTFSALLIALAVFIKLTPLIIIPLMIMRRQWKWLAAFTGWSVLLLAISVWQLGWENHQIFLTKIMPAMSNGIPERNNRSLMSVFQFIKFGKIPSAEDIKNGATVLPDYLNTLFKVPGVLLFLAILYYSWRINKTSSNLIIEIYLLLLLSVIISPVSWRHGYILTILPLIFIWLHPLTQNWSKTELCMLMAATVSVFSVLPDYGLSVNNNLSFQMIMILVMPVGALISMFLLLKIQNNLNNTLRNNNNKFIGQNENTLVDNSFNQ